jgi:biotin carboxyl carrier protein
MKHLSILVAFSVALSLVACSKAPAPTTSSAPAKVETPVVEAKLNTITLTPQAAQRTGIELATVENKAITRTRTVGAELISPLGQEMVVVAPFAGVVVAQSLPQPGALFKQGAAVLSLLPIAGGDSSGSDDSLKVKQAEYQAIANRLERAEKLLAAGSTSVEEIELIRADAVQALAALNLVQAQHAVLQGRPLGGGAQAAAMPMTSPQTGVLQAMLVVSGQTVVAGQPLFQVQSQQPLWVKVAVFSGDLAEIDTRATARITGLEANGSSKAAMPVNGPLTTHPGSAAVDIFYRIDNTDGALRAGEQVRIALPLKQSRQSLVVPHGALYQDMYGSSYVYERTGDNVFVRRRVEVSDVVDGQAVLTRGVAAGAQVVSVGVAELAGAEFGVAK